MPRPIVVARNPQFRERTKAENKAGIQHDVDQVCERQRTQCHRRVAGAAKGCIQQEQEQDAGGAA
jgi:hypothetical protein